MIKKIAKNFFEKVVTFLSDESGVITKEKVVKIGLVLGSVVALSSIALGQGVPIRISETRIDFSTDDLACPYLDVCAIDEYDIDLPGNM